PRAPGAAGDRAGGGGVMAVAAAERAMRSGTEPLLEVRDLRTTYSLRGSFFDRLLGREAGSVKAVDGVSFDLRRGEVLGIVGESGSGKTTLGRTLLGLVRSSSGSIRFGDDDIAGWGERRMRPLR